jgi:hypothetical protein
MVDNNHQAVTKTNIKVVICYSDFEEKKRSEQATDRVISGTTWTSHLQGKSMHDEILGFINTNHVVQSEIPN